MKNFKDVWEDAAANSVAGGGVSLPADAVHDKKKRKKSVYDGRTKEGRKFVERMIARKKARKEAEEKKLHAQNMKSVAVKEESADVEEAKAPKVKKLQVKGDTINGLRNSRGITHSATLISMGVNKVGFRVVDEFGSIETIDLKSFAKKFG